MCTMGIRRIVNDQICSIYSEHVNVDICPMHPNLSSVHCTLTIVHYIVYIGYCAMYIVQCILYIGYCAKYIAHCTMYNVHYILVTVLCTLYNVHYILNTVLCTLYNVTVYCTLYSVECSMIIACFLHVTLIDRVQFTI